MEGDVGSSAENIIGRKCQVKERLLRVILIPMSVKGDVSGRRD